MDYVVAPFIFFVVVSVGLPFLIMPLVKRNMDRRRAVARDIAQQLGFGYHEGWDVLRSELNTHYSPQLIAWMEKLPGFIKNYLESMLPWSMEGVRAGVRVLVYTETRSSGKNSTTYLVCKAVYPAALPFKLRATKEGVFSKIGKAVFNLRDVEIGNMDFDPKVRIVSDDPNAAGELFYDKERAAALLSLLERYPTAWVDQDGAGWERVGSKLDYAEINDLADALTAFAATMRAP